MEAPSTANPKRSPFLGVAGLCVLNIIAAVDATALSVAIPAIAKDLHATTIQTYWTGTAFLLSSAVCQPLFAAFSNAFGRRPMILLAITLFTVGTIVCALAPHIGALLAGRAIQGAGGGGMLTMTSVVFTDLFVLRERAKWTAVVSLMWLVGTVCGPVLGGGFTDGVSWRWIFWICLPFLGIGYVLVGFFLRTPHRQLHPYDALKQIDWLGSGVFVGSITSFMVALSWGGVMYAWSSVQTIVPLILGAVGLLAWLSFEHTIPAAPILPLVILRNRTACAAFLGTLITGMIQFGLLYYLPLYYQISKGYSSLACGLALLPQCLVSGPMSAMTGIVITKSGRYRPFVWFGWLILALGCGILPLLELDTSVVKWIFLNVVSGVGLGLLFVSLTMAAQAATIKEHIAIASGLVPFFRAVGQALGIVIGNAVFQNVLKRRLAALTTSPKDLTLEDLAKDVALFNEVVRSLPRTSPVRVELVMAFNHSLHAVWWTLTSFAMVGAIFSLLIKAADLNGEAMVPAEVTGNPEKA